MFYESHCANSTNILFLKNINNFSDTNVTVYFSAEYPHYAEPDTDYRHCDRYTLVFFQKC